MKTSLFPPCNPTWGGGTPPAFLWRNRPPTPRKLMDHRRFRTGHRGSLEKKTLLSPPPTPPPPKPPRNRKQNHQTPNLKLVLLRGRRLELEALKLRGWGLGGGDLEDMPFPPIPRWSGGIAGLGWTVNPNPRALTLQHSPKPQNPETRNVHSPKP